MAYRVEKFCLFAVAVYRRINHFAMVHIKDISNMKPLLLICLQKKHNMKLKPCKVHCPQKVRYYLGAGHIYQQTFIDTYAKVAFTKLYDRKNALVAAERLNDKVVPFYKQHDLRLLRILTDRGTEYCDQGNNMSSSYSWPLKTSTIPKPRLKARRPTAFVSGSIVLSRMNSMPLPFEKRYIER